MAQLSFKVGKAPHFAPEIVCVPFRGQGHPTLKVEPPVEDERLVAEVAKPKTDKY